MTLRETAMAIVAFEKDETITPWEMAMGTITVAQVIRVARGYLSLTKMHSIGGKSASAKLDPDQRKSRASSAGKAAAAKLSEEQLSERARKAVAARWARRQTP